MKFAILSDIHGNGDAFDAVIKSAKEEKVDSYIIAGDLITDFPDDTYVINKVRNLTNYVIKGNREEYVLKWPENIIEKNIDNYDQYLSVKFAYENLNNSDIDYIKSLDDQISIKVNNKYSIRVCHGSPFDMYDLICEDNINMIEKSLSSINENILICGHTHMPFFKYANNKIVINSGSVGVHYSNKIGAAEYFILEINEDSVNIEYKKVKYNINNFEKRVRKSKLYEKSPIWTDLSIISIKKSRDLNMEFVKKAIEISKGKGTFKNGLIDNETWNSLANKWYDLEKI